MSGQGQEDRQAKSLSRSTKEMEREIWIRGTNWNTTLDPGLAGSDAMDPLRPLRLPVQIERRLALTYLFEVQRPRSRLPRG